MRPALLRNGLLVLAGVLILALAAAYLWRRDLAEFAGQRLLAQQGYPEAALTVVEVTSEQVEITGLDLGDVRAERVLLRYRPLDLLGGRLLAVEVESPLIALDLTEVGLTGGAAGSAFELPDLPRITVRNGEASVKLAEDSLSLTFDAKAVPQADGSLAAEASFQGLSTQGDFEGRLTSQFEDNTAKTLNLQARLGGIQAFGDRLQADPLTLELAEGRWSGAAKVTGTGFQADLKLRSEGLELPALQEFEASAELAPESPFWSSLGLPPPVAGLARGQLSLSARPASWDGLPTTPAGWLAIVSGSAAAGDLGLELSSLRWEEPIAGQAETEPLTLSLPLSFASAADGLDVALPGEAELSGLANLSALTGTADFLQALQPVSGLRFSGKEAEPPVLSLRPAEAWGLRLLYGGGAALLAGDGEALSLQLAGHLDVLQGGEAPSLRAEDVAFALRGLNLAGRELRRIDFQGDLGGSLEALQGQGQLSAELGKVALDDFTFGRLELDLPLAFTRRGDRTRITLREDGRLRWAGVASETAFELPERHELVLTKLQLDQKGNNFKAETRVAPNTMTLRLPAEEGSATTLQADLDGVDLSGSWSAYSGLEIQARIPAKRLRVPAFGLEAEEVLATESFWPQQKIEKLTLSVGRLRHAVENPAFAPIALQGKLDHRRDLLVFSGDGRNAEGEPVFVFEGTHDVEGQGGRARLTLDDGLFAGERRALRGLFPSLPDLAVTKGALAGEAVFSWQGDAISSEGRLALDKVGLEGEGLALEGLNGELVLDSLLPPRTPPGQALTAEQVSFGETLKDVKAVFRISTPGEPESLRIDLQRVDAVSAFGPLAVIEGRAEPLVERYRLPLQIADLDLETLSESAAIEGLDGQGHLSGLIPLEIAGGALRIEGASLANKDKGTLRFRSEAAKQALAAGGEPVILMLRALENFEYDELELSADSDDQDQLELFVTTLGSNPKVLDGHPFRFNIRLTSNLPQLTEALRQGSGLTQGVLGELWRYQP